MKPARKIAQVSRRFYRPEQSHCADCQRRLRRAVTLTERTVITLEEVIKLVHAGYRCPDAQCAGHWRTYRSVKGRCAGTAAVYVWTGYRAAGRTAAPERTPDGG